MTDEIKVTATRYEVSVLPQDFPDGHLWTLTVEYRGRDLWAVKNSGRGTLGSDGSWDWEPSPSNREDEWLAAHRFSLQEALELAQQRAETMTFQGITPQEAMNREKENSEGSA